MTRDWLAICLALSASCGRIGFDKSGDGPLDARDLASSDAPGTCVTWSARHFEPCALPSPFGPIVLTPGTWIYDTTTGLLTDPMGATSMPASLVTPPGRVLSVDGLTIVGQAALRVVGNRPLIVASWDDILIDGTIDASSSPQSFGAGANPATCTTHAASNGGNDGAGGAGGGGGGFGGAGGAAAARAPPR
jgi:hypothetical protein